MNLHFLPLVDWGMGTVIIGVFALVCIALVAVVIHLNNSDKPKKD
jgi:Mg2+ and Co2+ transporter CorA